MLVNWVLAVEFQTKTRKFKTEDEHTVYNVRNMYREKINHLLKNKNIQKKNI